MALGSLFWGTIARETDIPTSLMYAAAGGFLAIGLTWRWHLSGIEDSDLSASFHWEMPITHDQVTLDRAPVMILVEYQVKPDKVKEFLSLVHLLGKHRKRDGAFSWDILESAKVSSTYVETYMIGSWLEHLRQHERVTIEDKQIQKDIRLLLLDGTTPNVSHFIGPQINY
jgi:hypothetical protein